MLDANELNRIRPINPGAKYEIWYEDYDLVIDYCETFEEAIACLKSRHLGSSWDLHEVVIHSPPHPGALKSYTTHILAEYGWDQLAQANVLVTG